MIDDAFGHWLAGFIDGEGCFTITRRGTSHQPHFALVVRDDDGPIIEEIHKQLGIGKVYHYNYTKRLTDHYKRGGRTELHIFRKKDLVQLVEILDKYPLRAKKALDFAIWRTAVLLQVNRKSHRGHGPRRPHPVQATLAALKQELEVGRRYNHDE